MVLTYDTVMYDESIASELTALLDTYNFIDVERTLIITDSDEETAIVRRGFIRDDHSVSCLTHDLCQNTHTYHGQLRDFRMRKTRVMVMSYMCYRFVRDNRNMDDLAVSHDYVVFYKIDINLARDVLEYIKSLHVKGSVPTPSKYRVLNMIC